MTFRTLISTLALLYACSYSSIVSADCKELSSKGTGKLEQFYVACTNSLLKPNFLVTQYYSDDKHFGVLTLSVANRGYFCSGDSEHSSCQSLPKGAIPYGEYKSRKSEVSIVNASESEAVYSKKGSIFKFPKSFKSVQAFGCFVVVQESRDVAIGLDENKLYQSSRCLIALERYISKEKSMRFR